MGLADTTAQTQLIPSPQKHFLSCPNWTSKALCPHIPGLRQISSSPGCPQANPNVSPGRICQAPSPQCPGITRGRPGGCPATRQALRALQSMCHRALSEGCSRCRAFSRFPPLAALQQGAAPALCPPPPQPQQALGIQCHELPGPARSSPQTSSLKAGRLLPWGKH